MEIKSTGFLCNIMWEEDKEGFHCVIIATEQIIKEQCAGVKVVR